MVSLGWFCGDGGSFLHEACFVSKIVYSKVKCKTSRRGDNTHMEIQGRKR
jgi:hypothetical protein